MFTGIIEGVGTVAGVIAGRGSGRLSVRLGNLARGVKAGDSVAVDGVCLTVVSLRRESAGFDVVVETCGRTTLGSVRAGDRVNLERPLRPADRLDGHIVQGHVDTVGRIARWKKAGNDRVLWVEIPRAFSKFVIPKGSVAVDGISLTIAGVKGDVFSVALIPHTLSHTTIGRKGAGGRVNIEMDVIAKMVFQYVRPYRSGAPCPLRRDRHT
jgi:riboflavin synthase